MVDISAIFHTYHLITAITIIARGMDFGKEKRPKMLTTSTQQITTLIGAGSALQRYEVSKLVDACRLKPPTLIGGFDSIVVSNRGAEADMSVELVEKKEQEVELNSTYYTSPVITI